MLGLIARERTGRGQYVETTMLCSAAYILSDDEVQYAGRPEPGIADSGQHGLGPLYRLYQCGGGGWIFVSAVTPAEQSRAAAALGLTGDDVAAPIVGQLLGERPAEHWLQAFEAADVPATAVDGRSFEEWLKDSGLLVAESHPMFGDYFRVPGRVDFSGTEVRLAPAAALGEHTLPVLRELGYDGAAIASMLSDKVALDGASRA
jgi:crotonobetainyl-CoA:carnitine CoA-transferase CaiB-like acyl-CoA transferase